MRGAGGVTAQTRLAEANFPSGRRRDARHRRHGCRTARRPHVERSFRQLTHEQMAAALAARGATAGVVRDILETTIAVDAGIYDADQDSASPEPTGFRVWCREVLHPAVLA